MPIRLYDIQPSLYLGLIDKLDGLAPAPWRSSYLAQFSGDISNPPPGARAIALMRASHQGKNTVA